MKTIENPPVPLPLDPKDEDTKREPNRRTRRAMAAFHRRRARQDRFYETFLKFVNTPKIRLTADGLVVATPRMSKRAARRFIDHHARLRGFT